MGKGECDYKCDYKWVRGLKVVVVCIFVHFKLLFVCSFLMLFLCIRDEQWMVERWWRETRAIKTLLLTWYVMI